MGRICPRGAILYPQTEFPTDVWGMKCYKLGSQEPPTPNIHTYNN